jgi:hypothetical protein
MSKSSDPNKNLAFQKVVRAFLHTPAKPNKGTAKRAKAKKQKPRAK